MSRQIAMLILLLTEKYFHRQIDDMEMNFSKVCKRSKVQQDPTYPEIMEIVELVNTKCLLFSKAFRLNDFQASMVEG